MVSLTFGFKLSFGVMGGLGSPVLIYSHFLVFIFSLTV